jgi:uroporphyrinogen-III decarboxylase
MLDVRDDVAFLRGTATAGGLREWVETCRSVGSDTNIVVGEADYLPATHPWGRKRRVLSESPHRLLEILQPTPLGALTAEEFEEPGQKPARTRMFLEKESDYAAAISLMREWRACRQEITAHLATLRREVGEEGLLTVFVSQPLEMYFFILHDNMVMHYLDWPETYRRAMDEVEATAHTIIDCAADAGADMIMFGGAGTEIFNPEMIERHIVQPSIGYVQHCRDRGLFSQMHCCGRTRIFLEHGWFEKLRPTIFESFTQAPLGDIEDPAAAAHLLPDEVFFKGGISLDLLRRGTPEAVNELVRQAYRDFGDRRFILSGTCAVLSGTPRENLLAATAVSAQFM